MYKKQEKFIEKYGVDNPVKSFEIKEKLKKTWSEKNSEEKLKIKQKITKTFKKYKNGHPMKDYKIVEKLQKKRKQTIEDLEWKHIKKIIWSYQDKFKQVWVELIKYEGTYLKEKTFTFKCYNCNNIFSTFLKNQKWIARCPHCYPKNETKAELEIFKLLNIHQNLVLKNDRILLKPLELDIFSPDLKFAVEYDWLMYHSFWKNKCSIFDNWKFEKLKKNNHLNKTLQCKEKGVQLFHIFENEWNEENKRKIWTSMINNKLWGNNKIFARKCTIKIVDKLETKLFLEKTHLQWYISSSINIWLYYNNELIQIMTFWKARYNSKYNYEIIRFSTKLNHTVTWWASKIFKYFTNNFLEIWENVITYADLRHSIWNIYEKLWFSFIKRINPNFFYFLPGRNIKLLSRLNFQKHKLKRKLDKFDNNKSNIENIYDNWYRKIYDCWNSSYWYKK